MPELPDILTYISALEQRILDKRLERVRLRSLFLLRTVSPGVSEVEGKCVLGIRRLGKRIVLAMEEEIFVVIHLMIAGRLQWRKKGAKLGGKVTLAAFDFENGTLLFTEASTKKRASLYLVRGDAALQEHDPGGLEVMGAGLAQFKAALQSENHTVKRSLTDPRLFSGIGNSYSDEILHCARLSPVKLTARLSDEEIALL